MLHCFDKKKIVLVLTVLFTQHLFAQITSMHDNQLWLKSDKALETGDYLTALSGYEKLYKTDSTNNELNFKLGLSNFQLRKYRMASKKYFDFLSHSFMIILMVQSNAILKAK